MVNGIWIGRAAVGRNVVALACLTDVAVSKYLTINNYLDTIADGLDFFYVPFTRSAEVNVLRNNDAINGAMLLIRLQACINGVVMVKYLNLHTLIGCILAHFGTDTYTVVDARYVKTELETIDEVAVGVLGIKVAGAGDFIFAGAV